MPKVFNTAAICIPQEHYMVNLDSRVREIKKLVDAGKYFMINRARQYGKTTTLRALYRNLMKDYYVVSGYYYRVKLSGTVYDSSGAYSETALAYSSVKYY